MKVFFQVIRPLNILIALLGSLLFRWISAGSLGETSPLVVYLLGVVFIMSAGYLINDYFDFKTDSINKPNKPRFQNRNSYIVLFLILNASSIALSLYCSQFKGYSTVPFVFPLVISLLWMYSYLFQILPVIGNLIIAFLVVLLYLPLMEGYEATEITNAFMGLSFIITWARELIKDIEDKNGDREAGYKTLPILAGTGFARILASLLIVSAANMLLSTFWSRIESQVISIILFFAVQLSLLLSIVFMYISSELQGNKGYGRSSRQLKASMIVFMLLVFISTWNL